MIDQTRKKSAVYGCTAVLLAYVAGAATVALIALLAQHVTWHG